MDSYLTVQEAAQLLGVSDKRVQQYVAHGQLPATKRGRQWWIKRKDVDAFTALPEGLPGHPRALRRRAAG